MAYPVALRERAIKLYRTSNLTQEKVCEMFSIGTTALKQWLRRVESGESLEPQSRNAGRPGKITAVGLKTIQSSIEANSTLTLAELSEIYYKKHKVRVGNAVMSRALKKLNLRHKKLSINSPSKEKEAVKKNSCVLRESESLKA